MLEINLSNLEVQAWLADRLVLRADKGEMKMEPAVGIEPTTDGLQNHSSLQF